MYENIFSEFEKRLFFYGTKCFLIHFFDFFEPNNHLAIFLRLGQKSLKEFRWFFGPNDDTKKSYKGQLISNAIFHTLLMFCLLNPQTNACEPNPKTTSSDFNR